MPKKDSVTLTSGANNLVADRSGTSVRITVGATATTITEPERQQLVEFLQQPHLIPPHRT